MAEYTEYAKKLTQRDASGNPTVSGWSLRLSGGGGGIAEKFWINLHQFGGSLLEKAGDGYKASYAMTLVWRRCGNMSRLSAVTRPSPSRCQPMRLRSSVRRQPCSFGKAG